jgi:hypothetical protein
MRTKVIVKIDTYNTDVLAELGRLIDPWVQGLVLVKEEYFLHQLRPTDTRDFVYQSNRDPTKIFDVTIRTYGFERVEVDVKVRDFRT